MSDDTLREAVAWAIATVDFAGSPALTGALNHPAMSGEMLKPCLAHADAVLAVLRARGVMREPGDAESVAELEAEVADLQDTLSYVNDREQARHEDANAANHYWREAEKRVIELEAENERLRSSLAGAARSVLGGRS